MSAPGGGGRRLAHHDFTGPRHAWRVGWVADLLQRHAPVGPVVDVGCGFGSLSARLAGRGLRVVAVDMDARRLRATRARAAASGVHGAVAPVCADAMALPLADGAFAGAVAGEVLEHVLDDDAAVREIGRALVPGGCLVATVPSGPGRLSRFDRRVGHHRRYSRASLRALIDGQGLDVTLLRGWGWPLGRLYDRWVQRPALRAERSRVGPAIARLGRWPPLFGPLRLLFAIEGRLPAGDRGAGLVVVAHARDFGDTT